MLIEGSDYFIYRTPFANTANSAMVVVNDDGTFDIYLNSLLCDDRLSAALAHELRHLEKEHFYSCDPIDFIEQQAGGGAI